ncbi:MAG: pilus assembly protein, partial [Proteobacteria bacterium]|nr:pilus assembly protein [Pseudomonadota bacterium]
MKNQIRRLAHDIERFWRNQSGVTAILFGLLLVPMLGFMGMAIDYGQALGVKTETQAALDATALAVAATTNLTESERIELGQKIFEANWSIKALASMPTASISIYHDTSTGEDTVTVSAGISVKTVLLGVISIDQIDVGVTSTAVTNKASPICILSLNKTVKRAINIQGGATLVSVGCAVQANSSHEDALYASGSSSATAEQFCTVGGYEGNNFTP